MSSLVKVRWADRKGWQRPMCGVMNAKMPRAPGRAVWQTCLHLIENAVWMACQSRGDPKWGVPALVIYLSAANPSREQPGAGHGSMRNKSAYSTTWQLKTTWGRKKKSLTCSKRKAKISWNSSWDWIRFIHTLNTSHETVLIIHDRVHRLGLFLFQYCN